MSTQPTHSDGSSGCPFTDPQRLFQDLAAARTEGGLPWSDVFGARVVTAYDDVVAALHDPQRFSSRPTVPDLPAPWRERFAGRVPDRGTLIGLDNPDHDRLRASVNTFFMPRRLARYEPWIREEAHRLVDTFVADGGCDLKTAFALPLPLRVICHVVGVDPERSEWVGAALGFFLGPKDIHHEGTPEEKAQRLLDLHDHLLELMELRRRERRDDLISHVWDQRDAGVADLTDFEMLSMFPGLMLAGHETTSNVLCTALARLLADPESYAEARRDDASRAAHLEELLRLESAITGMRREVTEDTVLGGVPLRRGEQVFLAYAAGSRDPGRSKGPTSSTPNAIGRRRTSGSAKECMPASALRWPGCCCASSWRSWTSGCPTCGSRTRRWPSAEPTSASPVAWPRCPCGGRRRRLVEARPDVRRRGRR